MKFKRSIMVFLSAALVACLCLPVSCFISGSCFCGLVCNLSNERDLQIQHAYADDITTAQYTYDSALAKLDSVQAEYNQVMTTANSIQADIQESTKAAFAAQTRMAKELSKLNEIAKYEYKNSTVSSLFIAVFTAENLEDMAKNIEYANSVMDYQNDIANKAKAEQAEFEEKLSQLNANYAAYETTIAQAAAKQKEATQVVQFASSNLNSAQASQLAAKAQDIGGGGSSEGSGGGATPTPSPTPSPSPSPEPSPTPEPVPSWSSGLASAYGGSSDPTTPNPGRTATGDICDDWSMGVAIPMSWPNYSSYFYHTVQISYGGRTVLATINDCGYMGAGSRSLDLQPGVFKALGFDTCYQWGVRNVSYCIM